MTADPFELDDIPERPRSRGLVPKKKPDIRPLVKRWIWLACAGWIVIWAGIYLALLSKPVIVLAATVLPPVVAGYCLSRAIEKILS